MDEKNLEAKISSSGNLMLSGNKLMYHQDRLLAWQRGEKFAPIFIEFGPTTYCNHKCIHCYVQDVVNEPVSMNSEIYLRFMQEIGDYGVKAIVLGGCGEPTVHKTTPRAIEVAVEHGTNVGMFTNGVPITDKMIPTLIDNLTYIRYSINGCSEKSHIFTHRSKKGDFTKVMNNLAKTVKHKQDNNSQCTIGVYTVLFKENANELNDWVKRLQGEGVDYVLIKPASVGIGKMQFVEPTKIDEYKDILDNLKKFETDNFKVQVRTDLFSEGYKRDYERCLGLPFMCAVDADGSVYACNWFWGNKDFVYGNLNEKTFPEIWESEKKEKIVKKISSGEFDISGCCGSCRQNSINSLLWKLSNPPAHINFI